MYIPKRYGQSKEENCIFCQRRATAVNRQGISVCPEHRDESLPDIKCVCGSYLELKKGKFGPFFVCINCGTVNMRKALEMRSMAPAGQAQKQAMAKVNFTENKDKEVSDSGKYSDFDYGIE